MLAIISKIYFDLWQVRIKKSFREFKLYVFIIFLCLLDVLIQALSIKCSHNSIFCINSPANTALRLQKHSEGNKLVGFVSLKGYLQNPFVYFYNYLSLSLSMHIIYIIYFFVMFIDILFNNFSRQTSVQLHVYRVYLGSKY